MVTDLFFLIKSINFNTVYIDYLHIFTSPNHQSHMWPVEVRDFFFPLVFHLFVREKEHNNESCEL